MKKEIILNKTKKGFFPLFFLISALLIFAGTGFARGQYAYNSAQENSCNVVINSCSNAGIFLKIISVIFIALFVWVISPIGILFFWGAKVLFSLDSSGLKRKLAWVLQYVAVLTWFSLMFFLAIIYLDAVLFKIFNLGGIVLNLALSSGVGFGFSMCLLMKIERSIEKSRKSGEGSREEKKKARKGPKIAEEKESGIKEKIRNKIKEEIKNVIGNEIDKRL